MRTQGKLGVAQLDDQTWQVTVMPRSTCMHLATIPRSVCALSTLLCFAGCDSRVSEETATGSAITPTIPDATVGSAAEAQAEPPAQEQAETKPPERIAAQHILISYRGAKGAPVGVRRSKTEARKLAEIVQQEAMKGTEFAKLVAKYSEDPSSKGRMGSVGMFAPDKMVRPFSEAAFALKVNGVSGVIETDFGFHVIKRNQ